MSNKKGNHNSLIEYNTKRKENTITAITKAILEIQASGYVPTINNIMTITGHSRGTFQQVHVIKILKKFRIGKYSKISINKDIDTINLEDYIKIEKELNRKTNQIKEQKRTIKSLNMINDELNKDNKILRMKVYELQLEKDILMPVSINNK